MRKRSLLSELPSFVILYVNDSQVIWCIFIIILSINWERKHACELALNSVTLNLVVNVITTVC